MRRPWTACKLSMRVCVCVWVCVGVFVRLNTSFCSTAGRMAAARTRTGTEACSHFPPALFPVPPSQPRSPSLCLQTLRQINWCSLKTKREPKSKKKLSKVATSSGNNRTNFGFFFGLFFLWRNLPKKTHWKFCRATFAWMRPKMVHNAKQPCLVCGVCS